MGDAVGGRELQRRALELGAHSAPHHVDDAGPAHVEEPPSHARARGEIAPERVDVGRIEINEKAFGEAERLPIAGRGVVEERGARGGVGEVHLLATKSAALACAFLGTVAE